MRNSAIVSCLLLFFSSCYEPEYHEPKKYLPGEINISVGGQGIWEVDTAGFSIYLQSERLSFGATHQDRRKVIGCVITPKNNDLRDENNSLFESNRRVFNAIKLGSYTPGDTLKAIFTYQEVLDNRDISISSDRNMWEGGDPEFCSLLITNKSLHDGEVYLSGSIKGRVYNSTLSPSYIFYEGTFNNLLAKKIN